MNLQAYIALLESSIAVMDRQNAILFTQAADDYRAFAQSIGHVQTGNMVASMHRLGPFPMGQGALEATIESGAWYAGAEASRGGTHDWPTRTVDEYSARLDELAAAIESATVRALVGGT